MVLLKVRMKAGYHLKWIKYSITDVAKVHFRTKSFEQNYLFF